MKPTHKTVYTMDIKGTTCVVGSSATAGTSHWRSAVSYNTAKAKHSIKSRVYLIQS